MTIQHSYSVYRAVQLGTARYFLSNNIEVAPVSPAIFGLALNNTSEQSEASLFNAFFLPFYPSYKMQQREFAFAFDINNKYHAFVGECLY